MSLPDIIMMPSKIHYRDYYCVKCGYSVNGETLAYYREHNMKLPACPRCGCGVWEDTKPASEKQNEG